MDVRRDGRSVISSDVVALPVYTPASSQCNPSQRTGAGDRVARQEVA